MELEERINRGVKAREILDSEIYLEAYDTLRQEIIDQWQQSPARDVEGREKLYLMLGIIDKLRATMQTIMESGKLAQLELNHKLTLIEQAKDIAKGFW